jgi:hypothetical protein
MSRATLDELLGLWTKKMQIRFANFIKHEGLDSKEPQYTSRRHSPERLILDLPRQLGLALQKYPPVAPPKEYPSTLEEVHAYLLRTYGNCILPRSLADFDDPYWDGIREKAYEVIRKTKERH